MNIWVNGQEMQVPNAITVADLIRSLELSGRPTAVEVNRQVVPRLRHADTALAPDDRVELVTLVGGG